MADNPNVVWEPQAGSQALFVACPFREVVFTGTRGSAKTDGLLQAFAQYVGVGFGRAWRGVIFRRTYKQLADIVQRSQRWFKPVFPGADFFESADHYGWKFRGGEALLFRHLFKLRDYENVHGHEYPFVGWEELTDWDDLKLYHKVKSVNRTSVEGVPLLYRATCNPYGIGHNAVKAYIVDPAPPGTPIQGEADPETGEPGWTRVRIKGHYSENLALLRADPDYPKTILASAGGDKNLAKAWLNEDWDVVAGGFFDDLWDRSIHVVPRFPIPATWKLNRSFDWGDAKPFSVGWWAESDGTGLTELRLADGRTRPIPKKTLFRIAEWYGWVKGEPNKGLRMVDPEIARGILKREEELGLKGKIHGGPADASMFDEQNGDSPAKMQERVGVRWHKSDKSPGSRARGWKVLRSRLKAAKDGSREEPGFYAFENCTDGLIRTLPTAPRHETKRDDIDDEYEDHTLDEVRYRILDPDREMRVIPFRV